MCLEFHPDKKLVGVEDEDEKERIEEYFKQIQDAYAVGGWGEGEGLEEHSRCYCCLPQCILGKGSEGHSLMSCCLTLTSPPHLMSRPTSPNVLPRLSNFRTPPSGESLTLWTSLTTACPPNAHPWTSLR